MKISKIVLLVLFVNTLIGQTSFVKTIEYELNNDFPVYRLGIGLNDELTYLDMLGFSGPDEHFRLIDLSSDGSFISGNSVRIDSIDKMEAFKFLQKKENVILASFTPEFNSFDSAGIFCFNTTTNNYWSRKISLLGTGNIPPRSEIFFESGLILSYVLPSINSQDGLGAFDIQTGEPLWSFSYVQVDNNLRSIGIESLAEYPNGNISTTFCIGDSILATRSGLAILNTTGKIINNIILERRSLDLEFFLEQDHGIDENNNCFVVGGVRITNTDRYRQPFIAKFDSNLDLVWAKRLFAENFTFEGLKHRVFPNGEVIFVYNTNGDLPVIVGKLDTDGSLLWHRGYSFFNPEIQIGSDGSIYFLSPQRYLPDGSSEPATLLAKADPNGDIEDCPQFDACLTLFDMDIPYTRFDLTSEVIPDTLGTYTATITPFTTSTEDYCVTPAVPTPFFALPDTICQNTILSPSQLNNRLAHAAEWTITGQDSVLQISDTSWQYQFVEPGEYQIEQEVWVLGCSEFFTKTLTVLPDDLGDLLGDDQLLCEADSLILIPESTRLLSSFDWSDGSSDSTFTVKESGAISLTATDGYCESTDEIEVTFFKDRFPNEIVEIPSDTTVCVDLLPINIQPISEYTNEFFLGNSTESQSTFEFNAAGNYQIGFEIEGCRFERNFSLSVEPCEIDIFIPTSFSPNDDGINDFAQPFGNDFTELSLEIYNRWGGKVFETENAPFAWDGKLDGQAASEGVYVLIFKYENQRNGKEEIVSEDVLLVR